MNNVQGKRITYPKGYAILQIIRMSLLFVYSSGLETIEEDIDMNGNRIIDLPSPTTDSEPVTKGYADTHYSGESGQQGPKGDKVIRDHKGQKETKATLDYKGHRDQKVTPVRVARKAIPDRKV